MGTKTKQRISASGFLAAVKPAGEPIIIPVGEECLQFRRITSASEHRQLQTGARQFIAACKRGAIPGATGIEPDLAGECWWLATLNICDTDAPAEERTDTQAFWLQVAREGGTTVGIIYNSVLIELGGPLAAASMEELDTLGED